MPAFAANLQKDFKLTIVDGLPQAIVEKIGGIHWLKCCPLCGCTHQILEANEKQPYTPLCQILPQLYKAQQVIWRKLYPEIAQHTTLHLIVRKGK
jgi:hypothetical protein